jgi:hypothetical protein
MLIGSTILVLIAVIAISDGANAFSCSEGCGQESSQKGSIPSGSESR